MSSGTAEVGKFAGRMKFRPIQLALECRSTEDVLDAIPNSMNIWTYITDIMDAPFIMIIENLGGPAQERSGQGVQLHYGS